MFYTAQLDENSICTAISRTPTPLVGVRFVALVSYDETYLGKFWNAKIKKFEEATVAPIVPFSVSRAQAKAALYTAGYLDSVLALMARAETPYLTRLAWEEASVFERESPLVLSLAKLLSLSDADLDSLFILADTFKF